MLKMYKAAAAIKYNSLDTETLSNIVHTSTCRKNMILVTVTSILNESDTLRTTSRTLIWGSHRPLHGVANVKSSVASDETGCKDLTLKHLLECSKVNRQPTGKCETIFKEWKEIRTGGSYHARTPRVGSHLDWVKRRQ
jgi:hypothetical protein